MKDKKKIKITALLGSLILTGLGTIVHAKEEPLKVGDPAPQFKAQTQDGEVFDLNSRRGHWTVLYFYPKSETPGCTKQACAFRDNIGKIRDLEAEVFGISVNSVEDQAKFKEKHNLNFTLLADPQAEVVKLYGTKMPMVRISKRWTFILDPELKIRAIEKDVDPALDADKVAELISKLKSS